MPRVAVSGRTALSWSRSILPDNRATAISAFPNNVSIGAAVADPFGGTQAVPIASSIAGSGEHNVYMGLGLGFASAGSMGWVASSCFFRYLGQARYAWIQWPGTAGYNAFFDLSNNTVVNLLVRGTPALTAETMHQPRAFIDTGYVNGWVRCTLATFQNGFSSNTFLGSYGLSSNPALTATVLAIGQGAEIAYPMLTKANWGSVPALNSIANPGSVRNQALGRV